MTPVGVAVIGCGSISDEYLRTMSLFPDLRVVTVADLDHGKAAAQAEKYNLRCAEQTAEALADDDVELVVNLTVPTVHADVASQAVAAGKHVWIEKPISVDRKSGRELLSQADQAGLRVGCAPDTVLGAGIQTARRLIDSGAIGAPKTVLTLMQGPGPESWHPNPEFLFAKGAGPLFDIGPYYFTTLVQILGPFERVQAVGRISHPTRVIGSGPRAGTEFDVEVPTHIGFVADFESGASCTSVFSFESAMPRQTFEVSGTEGTMEVPVSSFDGDVRVRAAGEEWRVIPAAGPAQGRGLGVVEMARALRAGRPHRATGELAYHVLDSMIAVEDATRTGLPEQVVSTVAPAPVLPDSWDPESGTL